MESRKRGKSNKGEDLISNLPDFIIARILSFLPTKDAVATSVLSKSWTYRWTLITELHFEDKKWYSSKKIRKTFFLNFVNRVLLHLNSSSIQSFSLALSEKYESSLLDQWISAVLCRRVKKLCVNSKKQQQTLSSHSLMKYKFLEELILKVDCVIKVPAFALLSSLTILNLSGIEFIGDICNNSGELHLDFPVLRTYKTKYCTWSSSVTLKVPLLKAVTIEDFRCWSPSDDDSYPTAIKFCASSLMEFIYNGDLLPNTIVFDLSAAHIVSANIYFDPYKFEGLSAQETVALTSKLLKQFKNVECLKFKQSKKMSYRGGDWVPWLPKDSLVDLPAFEMLTHLELGKITGETLLSLLLKTPCLKTLVFLELLQPDEELFNYDRVPDCLLNTLQVVKFLSLNGSDHELSFAKFVMESAVALKRMSFIPNWKLHGSNLEEVKEKLYSFKKCVGFAILEFSVS